jgi:hypothetical protein
MKKFNLHKLLFYFVLINFTFGCASFPKKREPSSSLNLQNITNINGKYGIKEVYSGPTKDTSTAWKNAWNFSESDLGFRPTFFDELNFGVFVKEMKINSSSKYSFTIKILNTKKLKIDYFENDSIIRENIIRYRLKKDGYLYLNHKNFKIIGIPYLFGGFNKKRNRITLNKDHNLLFETSEFMSGGLFLLMVNPLSKMKYEKVYQRINENYSTYKNMK